jgi:hypothetical protein
MKRALLLALLATPLFAQVSQKPADAIVPVVGSTHGQSSSSFKTELQLTNTSDAAASGWLIYRPAGLVRRYELAAFATLSFADVVGEMGGNGLGSLDVLVDGGTVPVIVARAYDDQPAGTTGVSVPAVHIDSVLIAGERGVLIAPRDLVRYRFNIGVRAVEAGALLEIIVRAANGTQRFFRTMTLTNHEFRQQQASDFAGIALQSDDSIDVRIAAGSAIVYATTVDNATNDGSIQVLRR